MLERWKRPRHETVSPHQKYDEYKLIPQFWAWVLLLGWSASLIAWALWIHSLTRETDRFWDYGQTAFTPAESIYSTVVLPEQMEQLQQLKTLPEAKPLRPEEGPQGAERSGQ